MSGVDDRPLPTEVDEAISLVVLIGAVPSLGGTWKARARLSAACRLVDGFSALILSLAEAERKVWSLGRNRASLDEFCFSLDDRDKLIAKVDDEVLKGVRS